MTAHLNNIGEINIHYFWDVDVEKLDVSKSKRLIIQRVFELGNNERNFSGPEILWQGECDRCSPES